MKIKNKVAKDEKLEKKNMTLMFIFDIYAEKTESFSLNNIHKVYNINYNNRFRNIIYLKGLYPRLIFNQKYDKGETEVCKIEYFHILNNSSYKKTNTRNINDVRINN